MKSKTTSNCASRMRTSLNIRTDKGRAALKGGFYEYSEVTTDSLKSKGEELKRKWKRRNCCFSLYSLFSQGVKHVKRGRELPSNKKIYLEPCVGNNKWWRFLIQLTKNNQYNCKDKLLLTPRGFLIVASMVNHSFLLQLRWQLPLLSY